MADSTIHARQQKRLKRLSEEGIQRGTIMVHERCRPAYDALRSLFAYQENAELLEELAKSAIERVSPVNVSQVRQLSPFRYPGGKTWLVPEVKKWLRTLPYKPRYFIEPFAGGGITALTVAAEHLADKIIMYELDDDVAAVWETVLNGSDMDLEWLCSRIVRFDVSHEQVVAVLEKQPDSTAEQAFRTILRNRMQRGGILAAGASLMKEGENGKGLLSRWYPETLVKRIRLIRLQKGIIEFHRGDGFELIREMAGKEHPAWFIDPPYTAGGKKAGKRLYAHSQVNHELLFDLMATANGYFMMTYDDSAEVRKMAENRDFTVTPVPMKNTHHEIIYELLITRE